MQQSPVSRTLRSLASLRLTLAGMLALGAGVLAARATGGGYEAWVVPPLALLSANLLCAILVSPHFRRNGSLLAFHVLLLAVVVLAAAGRLTHLKGRLEISEGQRFDPEAVEVLERGRWHPWSLRDGIFEQGPIEVEYAPGVVRGHTRSRVWLSDGEGRRSSAVIGDDTPLLWGSYRFYTTSNKGYAVVLDWQGADGESLSGAVHLPSFPFLVRKQINRWTTPAGEELEIAVEPPEVPMEEAWVLRSRDSQARVILSREGESIALAPGEAVLVRGGSLSLAEVRMWMGYEVFYDPTLPWLFAAALAGVLCMAWYLGGALWSWPLATFEAIEAEEACP